MASASGGEKKADRASWASTIESINPWAGPRSSTPTQHDSTPESPVTAIPNSGHSSNPFYGISAQSYPPGCPPLKVKWFHAVDVPKSKPEFLQKKKTPKGDGKIDPLPKKYVAFASEDSSRIERAYQLVLERSETHNKTSKRFSTHTKHGRATSTSAHPNSSLAGSDGSTVHEGTRVAVNEDFLFDVDLDQRELAPVYWLGATYDVRRGSWFYQEGSTLRACEENLSAQLEEGYLKNKPWLGPDARARSDPTSRVDQSVYKASEDDLPSKMVNQPDSPSKIMPSPAAPQPQTHRLFGTWMNSIVTYQDVNTAFLSSEGVLSWVTSTMYERFAGGAYMSGAKLVRGYSEPGTATKVEKDERVAEKEKKMQNSSEERKGQDKDASSASDSTDFARASMDAKPDIPSRGDLLKRQLTSLMGGGTAGSGQESLQKREEQSIRDDYNAPEGESQGRDIEHLVLVTHGIGQLLGLRMESINFVHDINTLRKSLKAVYTSSEDLRALNSDEKDSGPGNCRIQVLPVCWRHLLDFPKKRKPRGEQDIGEALDDEDAYPSLEDITVEGVAFARSLIADLALDILLYQSAYREQICGIVFREANRIYNLFVARNPGFTGKVHFMGHSLGSAIMFDILCRQQEQDASAQNPLRIWPAEKSRQGRKDPRDLTFDFQISDFYCLGSPIGLFQMLKGRSISARHLGKQIPIPTPFQAEERDDPFLHASLDVSSEQLSSITHLPQTVSSPKIEQLFNVFHPSDPIAYRLEPLISSAMSSLKPQNLPYTKTGIFGNVAPQGIGNIGAKIGQGVSSLWGGLAINLLNRSLGITQNDVGQITATSAATSSADTKSHLSPGAGTNVSAGVISDSSELSQKTAERQKKLAEGSSSSSQSRPKLGGREATLIDEELETLFSRFEKKRIEPEKVDDEALREAWLEEEKKAARLKREEAKVRALNRNGRVDYSIQESVLDFNPINTIASHMSYWADEDVNHFIMSQLLSNKSKQADTVLRSSRP